MTHTHVSTVIPLLAQDFDYVVVDTPAGLDERTLAALECATDLLLVSSLDVTSIRSLRKAVEAMDHIGVKATRHFVLNRADAKVGLDPSDAEEAVGMKAVVHDPVEPRDPAVAEHRHAGGQAPAEVGGGQADAAADAAVRSDHRR